MARLAEALQGDSQELVRIAAVSLDVIGDGSGDGLAALQVKRAKGLGG